MYEHITIYRVLAQRGFEGTLSGCVHICIYRMQKDTYILGVGVWDVGFKEYGV